MEKAEFRNNSRGICGAVVIDPGEKPKGVAVKPGETIWLNEEEQIATANAPRKAEDNPFVNGTLVLVTEPQEIINRRPIGHAGDAKQVEVSDEDRERAEARKAEEEAAVAAQRQAEAEREAEAKKAAEEAAAVAPRPLPHQQEKGVEIEPVGEPPEGARAATEEVGDPEAEAKPKPRPAKAKA